LEVLIRGVFDRQRFLDIVRNFVVFSDEPSGLIKRVAKYHQYWAVNAAVESTIEASAPDGDRRGGVVWHTQGSGKSIEMLFYAAKVMRSAEMGNPTLVFITDRNDLDDQLFGEVFAPARILPETPKRADTRSVGQGDKSKETGTWGSGCILPAIQLDGERRMIGIDLVPQRDHGKVIRLELWANIDAWHAGCFPSTWWRVTRHARPSSGHHGAHGVRV